MRNSPSTESLPPLGGHGSTPEHRRMLEAQLCADVRANPDNSVHGDLAAQAHRRMLELSLPVNNVTATGEAA